MTSERTIVDVKKLTDFTKEALIKVGVPDEDARITAQILVAADLRGIESHGVAHLGPFYIRRINKGLINVKPDIRTINQASSTAVIDGDDGLGFVVGYKSMLDAIERAEKTGAGFISVRNSTHYGAGAYYAMMALSRDMIGISMTQGGRGIVAPGSLGKGIGLNVISIAVPADKEAPFVLDMATGVVAGGKLELARRDGTTIPEGWAVDENGYTVTEVEKAVGGILPLGGTALLGAYKGFGLTVAVDILCSTLSGGLTIPEREIGPQIEGKSNHFFGALNISNFSTVNEFKTRMDNMIRAHHNLPKAAGIDKIYLSGELEYAMEKERINGIPLHNKVITGLQELAKELGINYDIEV